MSTTTIPTFMSNMANILDSSLRAHASRAQGKVVVITEGANGLGRAIGLEFARAGAKIVIGDLDAAKAEQAAEDFKSAGASALAQRAEVTSWDSLLSLFQTAVKTYGRVDVVIVNTSEVGDVASLDASAHELGFDVPNKPDLKALDINLTGVIYTAKLALFYFLRSTSNYKALIIISSTASVTVVPNAPINSAAKHGVLGLGRVLSSTCPKDTRICIVGPSLTDSNSVDDAAVAFAPVDRIAGAALLAATDPDYSTHGSYYTVPKDQNVFRIAREELGLITVGMYETLEKRVDRVFSILNPVRKVVVRTRQNYPVIMAALLAVVAVVYIVRQGAVPGILLGLILS